MENLLYFLGFMTLILMPFLTYIFIVPKLEDKNHRDIFPIFSFIPSILIFVLAVYMKEDQPIEISKSCGTVQYYKTYSTGGRHSRKTFERITLQLDDSKYFRHFRFEPNIARQNKGDHVCFEFHDRQKNSQLPESRIINWVESTSVQQ